MPHAPAPTASAALCPKRKSDRDNALITTMRQYRCETPQHSGLTVGGNLAMLDLSRSCATGRVVAPFFFTPAGDNGTLGYARVSYQLAASETSP